MAQTPDFSIVREKAFLAWDEDRREDAIKLLQTFLKTAPPVIFRAMALECLLPYLEANARLAKGLNDYSALDVNELPIQHNWRELRSYNAATQAWGIPLALSRVCLARWVADDIDAHLQAANRSVLDARIANVHMCDAWWDDVDAGLVRFIDQTPTPVMKGYSTAKRRVFVGCDHKYYAKYGPGLRASFEASNTPDTELFFHLVGEVPHLGSFEPQLVKQPPELQRLYYAASRLVRLNQVMEADPKPTVFVDADLFVGKSLGPLFDRLEQADVALTRMPGRLQFHTQFNASCCGFMPTEHGLQFLRAMASYIAKVFCEGRPCWCLDQLSMLCTLHHMRHKRSPVRVIATGPEAYDGSYNAMLWPQNVKPGDARYAQWKQANERFGVCLS